MRRGLFLALILVLGLFIFSGCELAKNPMEVESTNTGSTELTKSSEDTSNQITIELVNSQSNGNLVFRFYYKGSELVINSIKINGIETKIISTFNHPTINVIQVSVNPFDSIIQYERNNIIVNYILDDINICNTFNWDPENPGQGDVITFEVITIQKEENIN